MKGLDMTTENMPDGTHGRDIPGSSRREGDALDVTGDMLADVTDSLVRITEAIVHADGSPEDVRTAVKRAIDAVEGVQAQLDEVVSVLDRVID